MIDNGVITVDGHTTNESHTAFKTLLPNYEKVELSTTNNGKVKAKVNYAHTYDNVVNVIVVKEKQNQEHAQAITRIKAKVVLPGPTTNTSFTIAKQYNLVEQLQKTPAQISILELLKLSPAHKEILEKALVDTTVSKDLDIDQFQTMVGYLTTPHCLSFTKEDDMSLQHPHNAPLHIEVLIQKT
ncbi:hypothetical protein SUGI_0565650 [Cryptomeria japonica]|nr:hypothetical protein SUGI_0565650 [Cryptomeria japonica]